MFEDTNFIPLAGWEQALAEQLGQHVVAMRFIISLLASALVQALWRWVPRTQGRHLYSLLTGALAVYYPFGNGCIHLVVPTLLTYFFIARLRQHCGTLTWLLAFPYLIVCHSMKASGMSWKSGAMDFTGAQMVLTLRLVAVAVCCQDGARVQQDVRPHVKANRITGTPSLLEFLGYVFACGNLLVGPVYEYAEYRDYVERRGSYKEPLPSPWAAGTARLLKGFFYMAAYTALSPHWPMQMLEEPWYIAQPFWARWAALMLIALVYRFKYYAVWAVAESGLVFGGLCYNGPDEQGRPKWNKYINCRIRRIEACTSASLLATNWNVATDVYERLTPPNKKPTFLTLLITQLISGVWHGMYSGYVLFFSGLAFFFEASRVIYRYERAAPAWVASFPPWVLIKWLYTMTTLNYLAVAFLVLSFGETLQVWKSLNFIGHAMMIAVVLVGWTLPPPRPKKTTEAANGSTPDQRSSAATNGTGDSAHVDVAAFANGQGAVPLLKKHH